jgi:hypothetical protein
MRGVTAVSAASAILGYLAVYFAFFSTPAPRPEPDRPGETQPADPVVLAHVVDVTDLDPLLDPVPAPPAGLPFDPTEPPEPASAVGAVSPSAAPPPIPPAAD